MMDGEIHKVKDEVTRELTKEVKDMVGGQADFGPIDNLPMAGGSRSEVCFCLVKIDI